MKRKYKNIKQTTLGSFKIPKQMDGRIFFSDFVNRSCTPYRLHISRSDMFGDYIVTLTDKNTCEDYGFVVDGKHVLTENASREVLEDLDKFISDMAVVRKHFQALFGD